MNLLKEVNGGGTALKSDWKADFNAETPLKVLKDAGEVILLPSFYLDSRSVLESCVQFKFWRRLVSRRDANFEVRV